MKTCLSRADTLFRVNATWRCQDNRVCVAAIQKVSVLTEANGSSALLRCFESVAIRVTNRNQFGVA
jgi:hypothetical protein